MSTQHPVILEVAIDTPLRRRFDYLAPDNIDAAALKPGLRVEVPFGSRHTIGMLLGIKSQSTLPLEKLKSVTTLLDPTALLPPSLLKLAQWVSDYYQHPIGEVLLGHLPKALRQGKALSTEPCTTTPGAGSTPSLVLNKAQQHAVDCIKQCDGFQPFLLDGITGSGKTEVYLHVIEHKLAQGKQCLVLVPEIGLTPQTVARFQQRFDVPIVVHHSRLNHTEKFHAWCQARSGEASIVIGTRSAIFTPLAQPGLIILDESHDLSFKQQSKCRYSARDVAAVRGQLENIPVVFGSATPSLESMRNAKQQRYGYLRLPERAGVATPPTIKLLNLRGQKLQDGICDQLLTAMALHLNAGQQVLVFINRRGYAPTLLCHNCGWAASCQRCDARLALHQQPPHLICHPCASTQAVPHQCAHCQSIQFLQLGVGTERLQHATDCEIACHSLPSSEAALTKGPTPAQ